MIHQAVSIPTDTTSLPARLHVPDQAVGIVVLVQGLYDRRDPLLEACVMARLADASIATMVVELGFGIHVRAEDPDHPRRCNVMHVLGQRLLATTDWLRSHPPTSHLPLGYFGVDIGAGAACAAAAARPGQVACLVSWEGRLDLVGHDLLSKLQAAALVLVREGDAERLAASQLAVSHLRTEHWLELVPRCDIGLDRAGTHERVASRTRMWCERYFQAAQPRPAPVTDASMQV